MPVTTADLPNLANLDKVFRPDEGYTKLDLLAYYQHVAPVLLPYLVDRPQSMCRRPDGWKGKEFYQRISRTQPRWILTAPVVVERGRRSKAFVLVNFAARAEFTDGVVRQVVEDDDGRQWVVGPDGEPVDVFNDGPAPTGLNSAALKFVEREGSDE